MTDAEKMFFTGGAHARAAHALIHAAKLNVHMNVPFYLLVGFSLETVLKATYLHLGGDMKVVINEIRHDLPIALALAQERGFQPENGHLEWLTETMADVHRSHAFRYLTGEGELLVADPTCSLSIIDDLIAQIGQLLYPQHDRDHWLQLLATFDASPAF